MPFGIRHMYRKLIIYCVMLAALLLLTLSLAFLGTPWQSIALVWLGLALFMILSYAAFNRVAIWLRRGKATDNTPLIQAVESMCKKLNLQIPKIVLVEDPVPDVFAGGASDRYALLFVTSGLLTEFKDGEIEAVILPEIEAIAEMGGLFYNLAVRVSSWVFGLDHFVNFSKKHIPPVKTQDPGNDRLAIKPAQVSDVPGVVRLLIACDMYSLLYLHELNRMAMRSSPFFLVAFQDDRLAGFAIGKAYRTMFHPIGHLYKIAVDEQCRQKGLGCHLLGSFIEATQRAGCDRCYIEVRENNKKAISLYQKYDFNKIGLLPAYYPDGTNCMIMVKMMI